MLEIVENCPPMDFNFLFSNLNSTSAAVFAIFLFSCFLLRRSKKANRGQKIPEVAGGWPLIGHLHLLTGPELPHIRLGALADKYGPIFNIKVGIHPTMVISSWEVAKEIFTTYDVAVSSRPKLAVGKYLGHNYIQFAFAPYGAYWREIRKITALELLSNRRLELLRHVRSSEVEGSIKELYKLWIKRRSEATHVLAEMKQWFGDLNLNVILRMVAGIRYSGAREAADEKEVRRCRKAMREWFHLAGLFVVRDAIPFLGWLDLGGYEKAMKRIAKELDSIVEKWLEEHRHRKKVEKGEKDFLDILLHVLESIDLSGFDVDTVIKATVIGLLTGATDTTTVTITWVLALLLNNLPALGKVQKELDVHVGKERLVMESDIHKLEYLQAVVKEALRLYPAGPLSGPREFSEDCIVGGYHVPKGTRLIVNLWKLQRDPRVWSDPLEFRPERFLTTHKDIDIKGQHFELLPFGGGRRLCPGVTFGLQMTQLALASLLQAFDISTPGNASVDMTESPGLTNIKATPLEIMVKPRLSLSLYDQLFEF